MITDHGQANDELKSIAQSKGISLPASPSLTQQGSDTRLKATPAASFDQTYVKDELSDHEKTIALFRKEADRGTDPELKAFAQKTLPTLQHHLGMAKALKNG
jgi:putative membrane protein